MRRTSWAYQSQIGNFLFGRKRIATNDARGKKVIYTDRYGYGAKKPPGADAILYRLPDLLAACLTADLIVWGEGEGDADALRAAGVFATSHHQGASRSTPEQAEWLRGYRGEVVVCADLDKPGAACAVRRYDQLRAVGIPTRRLRIVAARMDVCRTVGKGADVRDHLDAGHPVSALRTVEIPKIRAAAERATPADYTSAGYFLPPGGCDCARPGCIGWHPQVVAVVP